MPIPSRQIGWSTQDNLLWEIAKQLEKSSCQLCTLNDNIQTITGTSGTSGTSGSSGTSGAQGEPGTSGTSGQSGSSGTSGVSAPSTLNYGLFAQTANSSPVTGTTVQTTLINGGVGTLSVPANAFSVGDSFRIMMGGVMNAAKNQTIRIRVKAGSIILLDSGVQGLTSSITGDIWSLAVDFSVRQIGAAGVASIVSLGRFSYAKINNGAVEGFGFNTVNNTTFDTTINNTLDITVQWGSNNAGNSIYSDLFVLSKTY